MPKRHKAVDEKPDAETRRRLSYIRRHNLSASRTTRIKWSNRCPCKKIFAMKVLERAMAPSVSSIAGRTGTKAFTPGTARICSSPLVKVYIMEAHSETKASVPIGRRYAKFLYFMTFSIPCLYTLSFGASNCYIRSVDVPYGHLLVRSLDRRP